MLKLYIKILLYYGVFFGFFTAVAWFLSFTFSLSSPFNIIVLVLGLPLIMIIIMSLRDIMTGIRKV